MLFDLPLRTFVLRFYLMMFIILIAGFLGQWWLAGFGMLVFLSAMLGYSFHKKKKLEKKIRKDELKEKTS